jgi:hypothetical protein
VLLFSPETFLDLCLRSDVNVDECVEIVEEKGQKFYFLPKMILVKNSRACRVNLLFTSLKVRPKKIPRSFFTYSSDLRSRS